MKTLKDIMILILSAVIGLIILLLPYALFVIVTAWIVKLVWGVD